MAASMACHALHMLPLLSANREVEFTGRNYKPGGSDEHDTVYRDTDRFDSLRGGYQYEGHRHLPQARHPGCDPLKLEVEVRWHGGRGVKI
jgi:hypothetical protein